MDAVTRSAWSRRWPTALAWTIWGLTVLGVAGTLWVDRLPRQAGRAALTTLSASAIPLVVAALSAVTVGAVLAARRPGHPVGWLLLAMGLSIVLRATGVEAEVELPFAALHQLLGPVLDRIDQLPDPQATALRGAFGLVDPETEINRFLVELGALSLLAVVAAEQPLLCLIGQARWLDPDSADTLVFVARRLEHEPMVLLFAARDGEVRQFLAPGLPELHLGGLDAAAAAELLAARVGPLDPAVRERLISETGGNPLALLELPAALTSQQLAGREPLPERLPADRPAGPGVLGPRPNAAGGDPAVAAGGGG